MIEKMSRGEGQVANLLILWEFGLFSARRAVILPAPGDGKIGGCGKWRFRYNAFSGLAGWPSGSIR